ncbi:hypothetical protein [Virgisporangium aurantiacum]|nr:hypothetical protein [Virgisporangium aurantiacum]
MDAITLFGVVIAPAGFTMPAAGGSERGRFADSRADNFRPDNGGLTTLADTP